MIHKAPGKKPQKFLPQTSPEFVVPIRYLFLAGSDLYDIPAGEAAEQEYITRILIISRPSLRQIPAGKCSTGAGLSLSFSKHSRVTVLFEYTACKPAATGLLQVPALT